MRIQETDRILKESRVNRVAVARQESDEGIVSRAWKSVTKLFRRSH